MLLYKYQLAGHIYVAVGKNATNNLINKMVEPQSQDVAGIHSSPFSMSSILVILNWVCLTFLCKFTFAWMQWPHGHCKYHVEWLEEMFLKSYVSPKNIFLNIEIWIVCSLWIVFLKLSRRFGFSTRSLGHVTKTSSWEAEMSWSFKKHDPKWVSNSHFNIISLGYIRFDPKQIATECLSSW